MFRIIAKLIDLLDKGDVHGTSLGESYRHVVNIGYLSICHKILTDDFLGKLEEYITIHWKYDCIFEKQMYHYCKEYHKNMEATKCSE